MSNPLLIVLSGPSGVGKDAVLSRMKHAGALYKFVVTITTRPQRPTETNFVDYQFMNIDEFQEMIQKGKFLEWAEVYGNFYGVPKKPVEKALSEGRDVIVKVDVQGAATIKKAIPDAIFIFLMPPSTDELIRRLEKRHTESAANLRRRLAVAKNEMDQLPMFDHVIVNESDGLDDTVAKIETIITFEKKRNPPRMIKVS
jgi:guanylate kinase